MSRTFIKTLFFLILLIITPVLSAAQKLNYGFQVGVNQTSFRSPHFSHPQLEQWEVSPKITFGFNTFIEYRPNKVGISIEPGYMVKALSVTSLNISNRYRETKHHFINLPLILTVYPKQYFAFFAGPEIAYNFYTEVKPADIKNPFINKIDFSISLGGLIRFKEKYGIGLKYSRGLNSLSQKTVTITTSTNPDGTGDIDSKIKSEYFQLFFRYFL